MCLLGINNKTVRRIRRRVSMLKSLQNKLNTYRTNETNTCEIYISLSFLVLIEELKTDGMN